MPINPPSPDLPPVKKIERWASRNVIIVSFATGQILAFTIAFIFFVVFGGGGCECPLR